MNYDRVEILRKCEIKLMLDVDDYQPKKEGESTRIFLNRNQASELVKILQHYVDTGLL